MASQRKVHEQKSLLCFLKKRSGFVHPCAVENESPVLVGPYRHQQARKGFAVAPILYILLLAGVAAGVLFSSYSQILRTNIGVTNASIVKSDLQAAMTTLAATSVLDSTTQTIFCPPGGSGMSADCALNAPAKLMQFAEVPVADATRLPVNYASVSGSGSPSEVGVPKAGSGVKQLDPWGHYYIYCRWENARNAGASPAMAMISAGANASLETNCDGSGPKGDDQYVSVNVGTAIQRASVWQTTSSGSGSNVEYGQTGTKVIIRDDGTIEAINLLLSGSATLTNINLASPLPIASGGTGSATAGGARANLGAGTVGDSLFVATTTGVAQTALGATSMGKYLFSSATLVADTASAVRNTLLGSGVIGDALFLASTASEARSTLGGTSMGQYLFSSSTLVPLIADDVRIKLLGASGIGNTLFTTTDANTALQALGGTTVGIDVFTAASGSTARTALGGGTTGSALFTAATQAQAWAILGLTGTSIPPLDIDISGSAGNVTGIVTIPHGGTGASTASAALDNLFNGDGGPGLGKLSVTRIAANSIDSSKLSNVVTAGTYNSITVDSAGRVTAGTNVAVNGDRITDGSGNGIIASATNGGTLNFSTAGTTWMTLNSLGYLGLNTSTPAERLHVNVGNIRVSNAAGNSRELQFTTGTTNKRWVVAADGALESGGNAGSDFKIDRYTDAGAAVNALTITRSNGNASFGGQVSATGGFLGVFTGTFDGSFTGTIGSNILLGTSATQTNPQRNGDATTGLFSDAAGTVQIATSGAERVRVNSVGAISVRGAAASAGAVLDLAGATGSALSSLILPKDTTGNRPTTGVSGMMRFNTTTNQFEGYNGSSWGNLAGGTAAANAQSLFSGWPDVVVCADSGGQKEAFYHYHQAVDGTHYYRMPFNTAGDRYIAYNSAGNYSTGTGLTGYDCYTNSWTISQLISNGRAFNTVNGSVAATASVTDGTSGAPGIYFDADQDTGLYRPTANTIGFSTGGVEAFRITNGAMSVKGASASAGAVLDLAGATGTALSSIVLPKDTTANRPTTPVTGMVRYNTTNNAMEVYQGSTATWTTLLGSTGTIGSGIVLGASATQTNPSRNGDVTTGLYSNTASTVKTAVAGVERLAVTSTGARVTGYLDILSTASGITFGGTKLLNLPSADPSSLAVGLTSLAAMTGSWKANTAVGNEVMPSMTTGVSNSAVGYTALNSLTTGRQNNAVGAEAMYLTTTGVSNNAFGYAALRKNTGGSYNNAFGDEALLNNLTGEGNNAFGSLALNALTTGINNSAIGESAGLKITTGTYNSFFGDAAGAGITTGSHNIAIGSNAIGLATSTGSYNTAIGLNALNKVKGSNNIAIGKDVGQLATTGTANVIIGNEVASNTLTTGSSNILIGTSSLTDVPTAATNNWLNIGNTIYGNMSTKAIGLGGTLTTITAGAVLDMASATGTALSSVILPKDTSSNRPTTGVAGMMRFNTTTNQFEGYNGTAWGSIGGSTAAANGQSMLTGWPDVIVCYRSDINYMPMILSTVDSTGSAYYRNITNGSTSPIDYWIKYTSAGAYSSYAGNVSNTDCVTNAWSIAQLVSNGKAFNLVNGSVAATASVTDGTSGAPGIYFDADQDTGLYRPAANTIGFSTGGVEAFRISSGAMSVKGATASAGAVLDLAGATGTALSSIIMPKDTTANRPTTGVAGMIRFNTTTNQFEGYNGSSWGNLAGGSAAANAQSIISGWPDAIVCTYQGASVPGPRLLYLTYVQTGVAVWYRYNNDPASASAAEVKYNINGTYNSNTLTDGVNYDCVSNSWTIAQMISNGKAFNVANGSVAATASVTDGTSGAPGIYFDADQDTGLYRPAANTIGFSTGGVEAFRISSGAMSVKGATASAGAVLDLAGATGTALSSVVLPKDTTTNRPTTGVAGMIRFNTTTSQFEGYNGSSWGNLAGGGQAANAQSLLIGWPDVIVCKNASNGYMNMYLISYDSTTVEYRYIISGTDANDYLIRYLKSTGAYNSNNNMSTMDCVSSAWSISQLVSNGRAFNIANGSVAATANITDGTSGAPGIYFDADQDTGLYRPAANTIGFSTAGVEKVRIDGNGAISVKGATASAGAVLDLAGATGTALSSVVLPKDTTTNRPTTGVAGMIRFNTTSNQFEGYNGTAWGGLGGGALGASATQTSPARADDITTGLFSDTASVIQAAIAGVERLRVTATGAQVTGNINLATASGAIMASGSPILWQPAGDPTSIAVGRAALPLLTTTNQQNAVVGVNAAGAMLTGSNNAVLGYNALATATANTNFGVSVGGWSQYNRKTGNYNSALGYTSLYNQTSGASNTAMGYAALYGMTAGDNNTALGAKAGSGAASAGLVTGSNNTIIGAEALNNAAAVTATSNTVIGYQVAKTTFTNGSNNILIGTSSAVDTPAAATSNWLNIGNTIYGDLTNRSLALGTGVTSVTSGAVLDLGKATGTALSSLVLPKDTTTNRPTTGVAGMIRFNTTSNQFEGYNGSSWGNIGGSTAAANGQSLASGWPDVLVCNVTSPAWGPSVFHSVFVPYSGRYYYRLPSTVIYDIIYNADGSFSSYSGLTTTSCGTTMADNVANGRAFNIVNGSVAATASVTDGTSGAPGIYFDADQDTGLYRPAANTIGFSTGGVEKVRIDGNGAISVKGATASAGAVLDLAGATGTALSSVVLPKDTTTNRPTTGVAGMIRFNTTTNQFEGYNGSSWGNLAGSGQAANAQSFINGFPDAIICRVGAYDYVFLLIAGSIGAVEPSYRVATGSDWTIVYNNNGTYKSGTAAVSTADCVTNAWTIAYLISNGKAFNIVNGSVAATASVTDGTSGAPGIYFDADQDTGLYRPAANTIGFSTGGVEAFRIANGAMSVKGATASAGAVLDLAGATGTALSSIVLPKDTTANRPTTGVAGMIRFNTTTSQFEGYNGSSWGNLAGGGQAANAQSILIGWPDAIVCNVSTTAVFVLYIGSTNEDGIVWYQNPFGGNNYRLNYTLATGAYINNNGLYNGGTYNCVGKSVPQLISNGQAFNIANGAVAATASVTDGTSGAPGIYFDADQDTGLYRPAANTIGFSTGGVEAFRIANGAMSVKGATASAGAVLDLAGATGTALSSIIMPKDTTANRPTTGVAGMIRFNTTTNQFEGYNGSSWGNLAGGGQAANAQSIVSGFPDIIFCKNASNAYMAMYLGFQNATLVQYRYVAAPTDTGDYYIQYLKSTGAFSTHLGMTGYDCVTNAWSVSQLIANGAAFNVVNGSVAATANITDGTSGAPGIYFDADQDTGLYRPAANTIGFSTGGVEKVRIDGNGAISVKGATASAGAVLDLAGATGTALSSVILPKDTTTNRPTTGVAGMIRFNTTTSQFEGYNGSSWGNLAGGAAAANAQSFFNGWPDAIVCTRASDGASVVFNIIWKPTSGLVVYRYNNDPTATGDFYVQYNINGTYNSYAGASFSTCDIVTNAWSISQLISNGKAFNIVNGAVAATASVTDGTSGAPGIYFDADQDTGLYRPAANTIGFSTSGVEKVRIDANGAISVKGATASAGAVLDLASATGTALSSVILPKDTTTNRPTTGVAGMIRFNTTTSQFEGYNGTSWGNLAGGAAAANSQSLINGWPDVILCTYSGNSVPLFFNGYNTAVTTTRAMYRGIGNTGGDYYIYYNSTAGYNSHSGMGSYDCVTNAWTISQLIANGKAFNYVNGSVAATASVTDGTSAAPGIYFDADQDTGLYRPAANTIGFSTSGVEKVRIDANGAISVKGATASAGAVLDLAGATGTALSSVVLPKDTTTNRPTTGVAGMIRFNTTTSQFEGYNGSAWGSIGGSTAAANGQSLKTGWPDVIICKDDALFISSNIPDGSSVVSYYRTDGLVYVRYNGLTGAYSTHSGMATADCVTNAWTITQLVSNGKAFNIVNGSVAATASVTDGTSGAPGIYFDADQDTGLYRPAANTIGFSTSGVEKVRIDANGAISVKGATASAGAVLDLAGATGTALSSIIMPKDTTANRPTTGVAGMIRFNTTTSQFEGYNGSAWGSIGGSTAAANGQSFVTGWPDALVCTLTTPNYGKVVMRATYMNFPSNNLYYYLYTDGGTSYIARFNADGSFNSYGNITTADCGVAMATNVANGRAFNIVNGSVAATASVVDGTSGAPGIYFDADQDTGLYRPAANTIGFSSGGVEAFRIANGAMSVKGASASAGAVLDLAGATGTALSSVILPKDTSSNRPTTGVAGMIRFNTTTSQFEGYNGSAWGSLAGGTAAANAQSLISGWPDVIVCKTGTNYTILNLSGQDSSVTQYRYINSPADANDYRVYFTTSSGAYNAQANLTTTDCVTNAWSITQLISNGKAFNIVNGAVAATASITDGTSGAPGIYFDADQDTGLYRPAANTIGFSSGGVEAFRIANGAMSVKGATASAGAVLDLAGATGTALSSVILPKDTSSNRPTTGVAGMIRFNTTTNTFEGYNGSTWGNLANGSGGSNGQSMISGWPDALKCTGASGQVFLYRYNDPLPTTYVNYVSFGSTGLVVRLNSDGSANSINNTTGWTGYYENCSAKTLSQLIAGGYTFNFANGATGSASEMQDGMASTPGLYFTADADTGLYRPAANTIGFATAGAEDFRIANGAMSVKGATASAGAVLDLAGATGTALSSMVVPKDTTANRPTTGVAGMIRFNTTTSQFEGYNGSAWGSLAGGTAAANAQTLKSGWPDAIVCVAATWTFTLYLSESMSTAVYYRPIVYADRYITFTDTGAYSAQSGMTGTDCITNSWSVNQLISNGRAFNIANGAVAATASITDGTSGAPGLYFDADQDTGLYRPAANTIGFSTGGVEKVRIDGNGAITVKGATASAGAVLDLAAATGTALSSMVVPKDTTANRPTTGVAGMIRFNTTTSQFEGYNGSSWGNLAGAGQAANAQSLLSGWPDVILCYRSDNVYMPMYLGMVDAGNAYYRFITNGNTTPPEYSIKFVSGGAYSTYSGNVSNTDCVTNAWSISQLISNGRAFNIVNGSVAATASVIDGTSGAPGIYFDADQDTGLYRPAANTIGFSTGGVEAFRIANGAMSVKGATASAGAVLDLAGATGTALSSLVLPKDTTTNRPTTGVAGMIRFNTTTSQFEGYNGSVWSGLAGGAAANAQTMVGGWPDVLVCNVTNPAWGTTVLHASYMPYSNNLYYYRALATSNYDIIFNADGSFNTYTGFTATNCNTTIAANISNGRAFNLANGAVAATANIVDGTSAAPGLYFDADQDTGLYRPAANTIGFSTGGVEKVRIDGNGAITVKGASASAGAVLDLAGATGTALSSMVVPKDTTANRPTTGVAGMIRFNTTTSQFEGYNGSAWGNLAGGMQAANAQTMVSGWPDVIVCSTTVPTATKGMFYATYMPNTSNGKYYYILPDPNTFYALTYNADGSFNSAGNVTTSDCNVSMSTNIASGRAFNLTNGAVAATANIVDGTSGAPGLYFDADQDTGLYRPAANTIGFSTSGAEKVRIDANGAITVKGTTASAGAVLDLAGATGTAFSSVVLPKDTTANRPTTGVAGMIRFNTTTSLFEGYNGSAWGSLAGSSAANAQTLFTGWPDAIVCKSGATSLTLPIIQIDGSYAYYRFMASPANTQDKTIAFTLTGAYYSNNDLAGYDCTTNSWSMSYLIANGRAFNTVNGAVAATANIVDGTSGAPGIYFDADQDTGLYRPAANTIGFATNGVEDFRISSGAMSVKGAAASAGAVLDLAGATGTALSSMIMPKDTTANRPTTGVAGMIRFNTTTSQFEGYNGSAWGSLAGNSAAANAQSLYSGWPDALVCANGTQRAALYFVENNGTYIMYRMIANNVTDSYLRYTLAGAYYSQTGLSAAWDCVSNSWSISQLISNGKAFNVANGAVAATASITDGTSAAPGLYFDADQDTGLYRPAANTIGFATSGTEKVRIDANGAISVKGASASAGAVFDLAGATGTALSSMILPKDTTANRPTTGVAGMIRFNTTTSQFEGYNGGAWAPIGQTNAANSQSISGVWPDVIVCMINGSSPVTMYVQSLNSSNTISYRPIMNAEATATFVYDRATGAYNALTNYSPASWTSVDCKDNAYTLSQLVAFGRAFNTVNGAVAATASITDGTAAAPGIYFDADQDTGLYRPAANTLGFATGGVEAFRIANGAMSVKGASASAGTVLDLAGATGTALSSMVLPKDTTANRPTIGVAGMIRFNTTTNSFEGYNGSAWSGLAGAAAANSQTILSGWPDAIVCSASGTDYILYNNGRTPTSVNYRLIANTMYDAVIQYTLAGAYNTHTNMGAADCITNTWSISQLIANGRAFNLTNGAVAATASITDGTAGAPGIYFDADQDTGLYRPAANTLGFATGGVEMMRLTATGSLGLNGVIAPSYPLQIGTTATNGAGAYLSAAGVWTNASDRRIKENIRTIHYGLDTLMKLKPVAYDMKDTHDKQVGFIAQDVYEVVPEVVSISKDGRYGLSYGNLLAVSVKAQQEMKFLQDKQGETLAALDAEMKHVRFEIESRLDRLEREMKAVNDNQDARLTALEKENQELRAALEDIRKNGTTPADAQSTDSEMRQMVQMILWVGGSALAVLTLGVAVCGIALYRSRKKAA